MGDLDPVFKATEADRGKSCHHDNSTTAEAITSIFKPVMHLMKLKVKFRGG
jgi:hypothetical protein